MSNINNNDNNNNDNTNMNNKINNVKNQINILINKLEKVYPNYKLLNDTESQTQYNTIITQIDKQMSELMLSKNFLNEILKSENKKIKQQNLELTFLEGIYKEVENKFNEIKNLNQAYIPREKYYEYFRMKELIFVFGQLGFSMFISYLIIRTIFDKN